MWPLKVELTLEGVESSLLGFMVLLGRASRFPFERFVHPLMTPVLLRPSWSDPFVGNAQLDPPDREFGQAADGLGGEGHALVGADGLGQAELGEDALEHGQGPFLAHRGQAVAAQQKAAVGVGDGERIAVLPILGGELAFEVGAPDLVGSLRLEWRGSGVLPGSGPPFGGAWLRDASRFGRGVCAVGSGHVP